jgi:hypothetical protein
MKLSGRMLLLLAVAVLTTTICFCHGHADAGVILAGVPIIGAQDMRIAYTNAYRSLYMKATGGGRLKGAPGSPGGPEWLPNNGNIILAQSDLISDVLLSANKSAYQFGINVGQVLNQQTSVGPSERRLTLQDQFYVAQIGYYLIVPRFVGGVSAFSTLYTHNPGLFYNSATDPAWIGGDALWDGNLSLTVNNRIVTPEWDLRRHYECPQTQYPVYNGFAGGFPNYEKFPVNDEQYGSQSGMYPVEPLWILDGAYNNVLDLVYNNSIAEVFAAFPTTELTVRLIMRGILAQNCSKLMEPGIINPR